MEDKWFICSEGPAEDRGLKVYFYRSWTGHQIATLEVEVQGEGVRVRGLVWEGSERVVGEQDAEGAKEMVRGVCRWVLGVELGG
jgi:hypothetical protein